MMKVKLRADEVGFEPKDEADADAHATLRTVARKSSRRAVGDADYRFRWSWSRKIAPLAGRRKRTGATEVHRRWRREASRTQEQRSATATSGPIRTRPWRRKKKNEGS
jgi:hypothetical protein